MADEIKTTETEVKSTEPTLLNTSAVTDTKVTDEKAVADKVAADKAAYDKLSPEDKKIADDKAAADKRAVDEKAAGAPEKYEDFKLPEGVSLAPEALTEFTTLAKELNLPQGEAQKLIDLATKNATATAEQAKAAQEKQWSDARATWRDEIKKDADVGGTKFDSSKEFAIRAVKQFGSPQLSEVFNTGWGDHPALFKLMVNVGKSLSEDRTVTSTATTSVKDKTAGQVFYPDMKKS